MDISHEAVRSIGHGLRHRIGQARHLGARLENVRTRLQNAHVGARIENAVRQHERNAQAEAQRATDVKLNDRPIDTQETVTVAKPDRPSQRTIDVKLDDTPIDTQATETATDPATAGTRGRHDAGGHPDILQDSVDFLV